MDNTFKAASMECQWSVNNWWSCTYGNWTVIWLLLCITDLLTAILCNRQPHSHRPILRMWVNRASTIFNFASWVIYVPIGCRHPLLRRWQLLDANTTATRSLPHLDNVRQRSVNSCRTCRFCDQGIGRIFAHITESLTALIGKQYDTSKENHRFQINQYCKLQYMQNILLVNKNVIFI